MPWSMRLALAASLVGCAATPLVLQRLAISPTAWLTGLAVWTVVVQLALAVFAGRATTPSRASTAPLPRPEVAYDQAEAAVAALLQRPCISLTELAALVGPIETCDYAAIGGGIGSFAWVDHLRNSGVPAASIAVIGPQAEPYARFRGLCRNSQISDADRLRSNSDACPDNLWGWPGYGVRECVRSLGQGRVRQALRVAWQLFAEPVGAVTYVPRAGDLYRALDRESARIDWGRMWRPGWAEALRQTDDGRYLLVYRAEEQVPDGSSVRRVRRFGVASFVHLATGYPQIRRLPSLTSYRTASGDTHRVVQAYEPHDHVYAELGARGGSVLLQGRGIAASRVLERLEQIRNQGQSVQVIHLLRSPRPQPSRWRGTARRALHHWELQPFNWPKGAWGGEQREVMAGASAAGRQALSRLWAGTTTAPRPEFERPVVRGLEEGWYQPCFGEISGLASGSDGCPVATLTSPAPLSESHRIPISFVIDATGLDAKDAVDPFWTDLAHTYGLVRTTTDGRMVTDAFELAGLRQPRGAVFAAGIATAGNAFGPVDSFLGLQFAALRSVDQLAAWGAPGVRRLNGWRSLAAWLRWAAGRPPA